jgi:hypothetical protein
MWRTLDAIFDEPFGKEDEPGEEETSAGAYGAAVAGYETEERERKKRGLTPLFS